MNIFQIIDIFGVDLPCWSTSPVKLQRLNLRKDPEKWFEKWGNAPSRNAEGSDLCQQKIMVHTILLDAEQS